MEELQSIPSSQIEQLLELPLQEFLDDYWEQKPRVARGSATEWVQNLNTARLDDLLSFGLRSPHMRVILGGHDLDTSDFTKSHSVGNLRLDDFVDVNLLNNHWDLGATLVLHAVEALDRGTYMSTSAIAKELAVSPQTNIYMTPPGRQGLTAHYDSHDVIVVQLHGNKKWTIHEPVVDHPTAQMPRISVEEAIQEEPAMEIVLEEGDVLYLPRGYVHAPETLERSSVHATVGLIPVTPSNIASVLLNALPSRLSAWRTSYHYAEPTNGHTRDSIATLIGDAFGELDPETIRQVGEQLAANLVSVEPRPLITRAYISESEPVAATRPRSGFDLRFEQGTESQATATIGKQRLKIPRELTNVANHLLSAPTNAVLAAEQFKVGHDSVVKLATYLAVAGALIPETK